jgi:cobalamin biosynthesis Mg chelatase CobN
MHRPRHRPRSSARLTFSLLSVLALLALASVPALAQAGCTESGCAQYEVEIPTSGGGTHPKPTTTNKGNPSGNTEPQAEASTNPGTKSEPPKTSEGNSGESEETKSGGAPGGGNNNNGGGGDSGNKPNSTGGGNGGGEAGLGESKPVATEGGKPVSHSSGGSSPLVPILIAIAVLAAISIGAVIYRQRRQQGGGGSGSPVSPKAG